MHVFHLSGAKCNALFDRDLRCLLFGKRYSDLEAKFLPSIGILLLPAVY